MAGNFHSAPFDDATLLKLAIYEQYLKAWLPVFIEQEPNYNWTGNINIFDFFSGPGKDENGQPGSPIIAAHICLEYADKLEQKERYVCLHFSDTGKKKLQQLNNELSDLSLPSTIRYKIARNDFTTAFAKSLPTMEKAANLIFIDQCGVKEVDESVFRKLISRQMTDFLFFISSSAFNRFSYTKYLNPGEHLNKNTPFKDIHRAIANMYRAMIPPGQKYYLAPFSLKKKAHIYGLIFGSNHLLGILKFLEICWKVDTERGTANFDIDEDRLPQKNQTLNLFGENDKSSRVKAFQSELREKIIEGRFESDKDVFTYTLTNGFLPTKHAKEVLSSLSKEGRISMDNMQLRMGSICIKEPRRFTLH